MKLNNRKVKALKEEKSERKSVCRKRQSEYVKRLNGKETERKKTRKHKWIKNTKVLKDWKNKKWSKWKKYNREVKNIEQTGKWKKKREQKIT